MDDWMRTDEWIMKVQSLCQQIIVKLITLQLITISCDD